MGVMFEYTGVVKEVLPIQKFQSGFEKREVILTDDIGAQVNYPNTLCFSFKKDRVTKLANIQPGMRLKIVFAIDGREWQDNQGARRFYTDLTGIKLDVLAGGQAQAPQQPLGTAETQASDPDDIPF